MKVTLLCIVSLIFNFGVGAQTKNDPLVYVKHKEPPQKYPALARLAQLQGTILLKLKISSDGKVLDVDASSDDFQLNQHPLLQSTSAELIKKWTFGCFNCKEGDTYEHVIKFVYRLGTERKEFDDTSVVMDLPNEVTVTANRPLCYDCPPPVKSKRKHAG